MLKISYQHDLPGMPGTLTLAGQVAGQWVAELRRAYGERHDSHVPLVIDLRDVTFIDRAGVVFFGEIDQHVTLINCSLFAAEQLKPVIERHDVV